MQHIPTFVLSAALLAAALPAQDLSIATIGTPGVFAGTTVDVSGFDQPVPDAGLQLEANQATVGASGGLELALSRIRVDELSFGRARFQFDLVKASSTLSVGTTDSPSGAPAPALFVGSLTSPAPMTGDLVVRYVGQDGGAVGGVTIVGPTGPVSLVGDAQEQEVRIPGLTLDAGGIAYVVEWDAQAPGNTVQSSWNIEVAFEMPGPPRCSVTLESNSCAGGGVLSGTTENRGAYEQLTLQMTGAPPFGEVYPIVAFSPLVGAIPFPQSAGCTILVDVPIVLIAPATDFGGFVEYELAIPADYVGVAYVQFATLPLLPGFLGSPETLVSTNVLRIDCP